MTTEEYVKFFYAKPAKESYLEITRRQFIPQSLYNVQYI